MGLLAAQASGDTSASLAAVVLVVVIWAIQFAGMVQWFRGGNPAMGIASLFVPLLGIAGFFSTPKPGSSRYRALDPERRAKADRRWAHAAPPTAIIETPGSTIPTGYGSGKQVRCPHCAQMTPAEDWPEWGDRSAFYNQTLERTIDEPGETRIRLACRHCGEDFYVVWDRDPRPPGRRTTGAPAPTAGTTSPARSRGVETLVELCTERGILYPSQHIATAVEQLTSEGEPGSVALAALIRDLLACRSTGIIHALRAAGRVTPVPQLVDAVEAVIGASELTEPPADPRFTPEIGGDGRCGWTTGTHMKVVDAAREAQRSLEDRS